MAKNKELKLTINIVLLKILLGVPQASILGLFTV